MKTLLSRKEFQEAVFKRDRYCCVFCKETHIEAHHIIERRLFKGPGEQSGYFLDNGASVCNPCHLLCEMTVFSVEHVREACGITSIVIPEHLYRDQLYDKWGNPVLPNGKRLRGELFYDESVQKILEKGEALQDFVEYVKYPRTPHLPWSPGITDDDRVMYDLRQFEGEEVVVTIKMDGENTSLYRDYIHARSLDYGSHPSRSWVRRFHAEHQYDIPDGWRVIGENLYAKHSIHYKHLESYFYGFSVWNDHNYCLPWEETLEWFALLGIVPVPVLYKGIYDYERIRAHEKTFNFECDEGYVIRMSRGFPYGEFRHVLGKFVRPQHVKSEDHWFYGQQMTENKLFGRR